MTIGVLRAGEQAERPGRRLGYFLALTKPRVVSLIVFSAVIGMFLAAPGMVALQTLV
jgi:heme o synthase